MEQFLEQVKSFGKRVQRMKENVLTEEATKTSAIMPFFQLLGFDVFNPEEFIPEFTADVGIKKGEKVDYAIVINGEPAILIEAKSIQERLEKHDSQLFRYFGTTKAKFAILTNGTRYRFYSDLEEPNKMDSTPFFEFNITDIRDNQIIELSKFRKDNFNVDNILTTASELKYTNEIKQYLSQQWESPSEEFVTFIVSNVYSGKKTKQVIERFSELVKKSLKQFISESLNDKLKAALAETAADTEVSKDEPSVQVTNNIEPLIVTTEEEIEGYVTVRFLLGETINQDRVFYRDNQSYFNILLDDNIRKWICRLGFNSSNKYVQFNDDEKTVININKVSDLIQYKNKFIEVASKFK